MQGFHHRGEFDPPEWANNLKNYYWYIRNEGRDKAKRRRFYRLIAKEKLKLAENGIDQELINAMCRYLCDLKPIHAQKVQEIEEKSIIQLRLKF